MTRSTNSVISAARAIRPYLTSLVGADAITVDREIGALLVNARDGADVEEAVLNVLRRYPATRSWTAALCNTAIPLRSVIRSPKTSACLECRPRCRHAGTPARRGTTTGGGHALGDPVPTCPSHSLLLQAV